MQGSRLKQKEEETSIAVFFYIGEGIISIKSSSDDLDICIVKVASLFFSPNASLSLLLASVISYYIKKRIILAKQKKNKNKRGKKEKRGKITRYTSPFTLLFDFGELITLLDLPLQLGSFVAMSGLLFVPDKFFVPPIDNLISKPLKASIFLFPRDGVLLF